MHTIETVGQKVFEIISDVTGHPIVDITTEKHLHSDLKMDSMDILTVGCEIEKHYEITIPDDDIRNVTKVGHLTLLAFNILYPEIQD